MFQKIILESNKVCGNSTLPVCSFDSTHYFYQAFTLTPGTNNGLSLSLSLFSVLCVVFGVVVCLKRGVLVVMACWVKQEAQS